jgi:LytS/YehU family sensor histidine kinase
VIPSWTSAAASASGTPSADAGGAASLDSFYGVGLTNVARRLDQLYGGAARLAVRPAEPGTCATLRLPLHAPAPA